MTPISARAAVLNRYGEPFDIEPVLVEAPRADEIRVRLVATGICHTDVAVSQMQRVPLPTVLGHEGAGVVEAVGDAVTTHRPGDHVVLTFAYCGRCDACREGAPAYCREFAARNFDCARPDGSSAMSGDHPVHSHFFGQSSFATYTVCSASSAIVAPKDVPLELLGPLGCGVQTGAGAVINALKVGVGASLAVFGSGAVGMSAIMAAQVVGATTIIAIDRVPARLTLAQELGATHVVLAKDQDDVAEQIRRILPQGAQFTLDTTGVPAVVSTAIAVLAPRGTCGLVAGAAGDEASFSINPLFTGGRVIRGVTEGASTPTTFIPHLIDLYRRGRFPFDKMVEFFSLDEINVAIAKSASGEVVKPIIRF